MKKVRWREWILPIVVLGQVGTLPSIVMVAVTSFDMYFGCHPSFVVHRAWFSTEFVYLLHTRLSLAGYSPREVTVLLGVAKGHAKSTDWLTMRGTSIIVSLKFPLSAIGAITKLVHVSEVILLSSVFPPKF